MAKITAIIMKLLSVPNIMGMGPIKITPPVLTSLVFEVAPCRAGPMNIKIKPMNITIIPAMIMLLPLIIINQLSTLHLS